MDARVSRRTFLRQLSGSAGLLAAGPTIAGLLAACTSQAPAPAAPPEKAAPSGAAQAPAAKQIQSIKFSLPWIPTGEVAFFYAAKKLGYWQQRGLDVDIQRGFGSATAAKQTGLGQFDFAQADMGATLSTMVDGLDLVSIGLTSPKIPSGIFALQKSNIRQPKDLEGKSIGGTSGSATEVLLDAFLVANNIDASKVRRVNLGGDVALPAMIKGEVDAITHFLQNAAPDLIVDNLPYNAMLYADYGLNIYSLTMITQGQRVKEQPELVQAFIDGTMEGLKYSYLQPEKTNEIFLEMVPEAGQQERDKKVNHLSLLINNAMGIVPSVQEQGLGYHDSQIMQKTIDTLGDLLKWKEKPDPAKVTTNQFVGRVKLTQTEWDQTRDFAKDFLNLKSSS